MSSMESAMLCRLYYVLIPKEQHDLSVSDLSFRGAPCGDHLEAESTGVAAGTPESGMAWKA